MPTAPSAPGRHVIAWDSPRLLTLIRFLDERGAFLQEVPVDRGEMATELDIPLRSLARHVEWARRFGAVRVRSHGNKPSEYRLVVTYDEWMRLGEGMVAAYSAKRTNRMPSGT